MHLFPTSLSGLARRTTAALSNAAAGFSQAAPIDRPRRGMLLAGAFLAAALALPGQPSPTRPCA
jgi:hypothetical protein